MDAMIMDGLFPHPCAQACWSQASPRRLKRKLVRAIPSGPAVRAGMLQLDPATWGQAVKGIKIFRLTGCVLLDLPAQASSLLASGSLTGGHMPAATKHDSDLPKSPFLQHPVTPLLRTT